MFHVLIRVEIGHRSNTSEKVFTFYTEKEKLRCCCGTVDLSASENLKAFVIRSHKYHCKMSKNLPSRALS